MASITVGDLSFAGADLFAGSENFMSYVGDYELDTVNGGTSPLAVPIAIWGVEISAGYVYGAFLAGAGAAVYTAVK